MPLLEILTRCYRRPRMLAANMASMAVQTDPDWVQTLLPDWEGRGVGWSFGNLAAYAPRVVGEYIWVLDDDDLCMRPTLVAELRTLVAGWPGVVMVRMDHGPSGILPNRLAWGDCQNLTVGGVGVSAPIVRADLWQAHAWAYGEHYAGDFDFLAALLATQPTVVWHDVVASRVQRISAGEPE